MRLTQFARRCPGRGVVQSMWFDLVTLTVEAFFLLVHRRLYLGRPNVPPTGAFLAVCNHCSYYDPPVCGTFLAERPFSPIGRASLFVGPFGWLIRSLGTIPINRDGADAAAMRAGIDELKAGRVVLVFPEGTRSEDGELKEFKRGVSIMIRKAAVPIVPMAIEGTFKAWPKGQLLPRPFRRIGCLAGPVIPANEVAELFKDPSAGMLELQRRIGALHQELRAHMGRTGA